MTISEFGTVFGWADDNGLGEKLIQQIIAGEKTATCSLKEEYSNQELSEMVKTKGKLSTVFDKFGTPWCIIRILNIFETTFGNPDMRLVLGEGNCTIKEFQEDHRQAWDWAELQGSTVLIVELFELVEVL